MIRGQTIADQKNATENLSQLYDQMAADGNVSVEVLNNLAKIINDSLDVVDTIPSIFLFIAIFKT